MNELKVQVAKRLAAAGILIYFDPKTKSVARVTAAHDLRAMVGDRVSFFIGKSF